MSDTWKVSFADGKSALFADMPPSLFQRVATRYGINWVSLYRSPGQNIDALHALLTDIAVHVGAEPPAAPLTMRDALALTDTIAIADDELPVEYENGFPQTAGDQATT